MEKEFIRKQRIIRHWNLLSNDTKELLRSIGLDGDSDECKKQSLNSTDKQRNLQEVAL